MGSEWKTIGAISEVFDGPHATPKKIDKGPYFLSISSLKAGKLDLEKSARISEEQFVKWTKRVTPVEGDLLFSYETRLGEAALMPSGIKACLGRRMGLLRIDKSKVDPRYLLFAYLGPAFQQEIRTRTNYGATVERIALKELPDFPIQLPPLPEQKAIAHILGSLDDKIELNRRMNTTLEGMAQALFKSWFVDFDPVIDNALAAGNPIPDELADRACLRASHRQAEVRRSALRANAEGRMLNAEREDSSTHHSSLSTHHSLFPAAFQETESMGWIPEGWESATLGDYLEIKRGGSPRPIHDFLRPEGLPWVKIADATASPSRFLFATKEFIKPEGLKKTVLMKKGALILSNSATPGLPMFLELDACIHDGWLHFPKKKHFGNLYLYQLFLVIREELVAQGNGSVFTNLKTDILRAQRIVVPPAALLQIFEDWMKPNFEKIRTVNVGARSLSELRDTLLPKLISGELSIPEAEKLTEDTQV
jgi:type I restriction enzyme S subunit